MRADGRMLLLVGLVSAGLGGVPAVARAACSATQMDFDGNGRDDLRIVGDARPQRIRVDVGQSTYSVVVDCNADGDTTDPGDIVRVSVAGDLDSIEILGGGNDDVAFLQDGLWTGTAKSLSIVFGPVPVGRVNTLDVHIGTMSAASLTLDVVGSAGADRVYVDRGGVLVDSNIILRGDLGAGDDAVVVGTPEMERSSLTADLLLGPGNNVASAALAHRLDRVSTVTINVEGSPLATQADGVSWGCRDTIQNASHFVLNANLLGGNDTFNGNIVGERCFVFPGAALDVHVRGGAGNDRLDVADTYFSSHTAFYNGGQVDIGLAGGAGADLASVDLGEGIRGAGVTHLRLDGDDGDDYTIAAVRFDAAAGSPTFDGLLRGGAGADALYLSPIAQGGTVVNLGVPLLDGGTENDTCFFFDLGTPGPHQNLRCERGDS